LRIKKQKPSLTRLVEVSNDRRCTTRVAFLNSVRSEPGPVWILQVRRVPFASCVALHFHKSVGSFWILKVHFSVRSVRALGNNGPLFALILPLLKFVARIVLLLAGISRRSRFRCLFRFSRSSGQPCTIGSGDSILTGAPGGHRQPAPDLSGPLCVLSLIKSSNLLRNSRA
jgi:hypothetical protein